MTQPVSRALRVSLASDGGLSLYIPSPMGGGHSVDIPMTLEGLRLIKTTLEAHSAGAAKTIGSAASPVQADINALLREFKAPIKKVGEKKPVAEIDISKIDFGGL